MITLMRGEEEGSLASGNKDGRTFLAEINLANSNEKRKSLASSSTFSRASLETQRGSLLIDLTLWKEIWLVLGPRMIGRNNTVVDLQKLEVLSFTNPGPKDLLLLRWDT